MAYRHRLFLVVSLAFTVLLTSVAASLATPNVSYTGVYLMGDKKAEEHFPVYMKNRVALQKAFSRELEELNDRNAFPFHLIFDTDIESRKHEIDNTVSLALVVVRDDIHSESFSTGTVTINKTMINIGLAAVLYDTRNVNGKDRNTVIYSFPLVGYSQQVDGREGCSVEERDRLFVKTAVAILKDHLAEKLAGVALKDITCKVAEVGSKGITISAGSLQGLESGQMVKFYRDGKKVCSSSVVKLDKDKAVVEHPQGGVKPEKGMTVKATNMRAVSDETYQVVDVKVTSKKAATYFPQEIIGSQLAQWFSNFLSERSGKVVMPSRVGGDWDTRSTGTAFSLIDKEGVAHEFELPPPKYPISLTITGVSSKVTSSNEVNDVCLFKAWIKISIPPPKKYEKEFDIVSSKCLIKGVQSFEEKNELYDLLYQLTAKMAKEAQI